MPKGKPRKPREPKDETATESQDESKAPKKSREPKAETATESQDESKAPKKSREPKADQTVKKGNVVIINPGGKDKFVVKIESPERPFRVRQQAGSKGSCVVIANGKEYDVPQPPKMMDLSTQGITKIKR